MTSSSNRTALNKRRLLVTMQAFPSFLCGFTKAHDHKGPIKTRRRSKAVTMNIWLCLGESGRAQPTSSEMVNVIREAEHGEHPTTLPRPLSQPVIPGTLPGLGGGIGSDVRSHPFMPLGGGGSLLEQAGGRSGPDGPGLSRGQYFQRTCGCTPTPFL